MQIVFFEDNSCARLLPLTYTKPVSHLRMGMYTMAERWSNAGFEVCGDLTRPYLETLFPKNEVDGMLYVNARVFPTQEVVASMQQLKAGDRLMAHGQVIATWNREWDSKTDGDKAIEIEAPFIGSLTDLFARNAFALQFDFGFATNGRKSLPVDPSNIVIGDKNLVFLAEGAKVWASTLNTTDGPIYLDKDAEIMEGSHVRGPFYLGEHSQLKMGAKVYGATTIGPHCKVGGEVSNSVIQGFSNKAHDGFLGNSVVGEWCNLGADTNTSNLKNNYGSVKTWQYDSESMQDTGLTFCGLVMGDHSKCGINTMLNTGTVVGVGANIFGGDFPPKHIPSFSWGGSGGFEEYDIEKMLSTASQVYARRGLDLTDNHRKILREVFLLTAKHRQDTTQSQEYI
jgi:UDP-N-acetylglucosamine diphosphorylase/glucosamine-1-phosphate N-acetyltransferase